MALENFLTYTEVDPNNRYAVAANTITVTGLKANEDAWVVGDKGAGHFGDFVHDVDVNWSASTADSRGVVWAVSNVIDDAKFWVTNASQALAVIVAGMSTERRLYFFNTEDASYPYIVWSLGAKYYRVTRVGASCVVTAYSDAARTNLTGQINGSAPAARTYRYVFGVNSQNAGVAAATSFTVANLNLNEPTPIAIFHHHCKLLARP